MTKFDCANTTPEELKKMATHESSYDFETLHMCNFECEPLTEKQKNKLGIRFDETLKNRLNKPKTSTMIIFSHPSFDDDITVIKDDRIVDIEYKGA